jgi:hypothetical protein
MLFPVLTAAVAQLPQDPLQDAAVLEVAHLVRGVEADLGLELDRVRAVAARGDGDALRLAVAEVGDVDLLFAGQAQRVDAYS